MKKIPLGLERIESLCRKMIDENQDDDTRALAFAAIKAIVDELKDLNESFNNGNVYVLEKIDELLSHAQAIAHLDDNLGHPDRTHFEWVLGAILKIKSPIALGPLIEV
jgi:Fe-S-cluster formation regulator IscX/YfhJ